MFASTVQLTRAARERGYAVPAVNVFDDVSMRAVVDAAQAVSAPLIIQLSVKTVRSTGLRLLGSMFEEAVKDATVPVALHLDHCPDRALISEVVAAGWSSVLFDASDRGFDEAVRETAEVVVEAHAAGVEVETEIENILGVEDGVGSDVALHSYPVEQLARAAKLTGADLLAPQLGTSHGAFKTPPRLLPGRVTELAQLIDRPIVLHGGTGLTSEDFQSFISAGVSKINISTAVKLSYMRSAARHLAHASAVDKWDPPSLFRDISAGVRKELTGLMKQFGAEGRASRRTR